MGRKEEKTKEKIREEKKKEKEKKNFSSRYFGLETLDTFLPLELLYTSVVIGSVSYLCIITA